MTKYTRAVLFLFVMAAAQLGLAEDDLQLTSASSDVALELKSRIDQLEAELSSLRSVVTPKKSSCCQSSCCRQGGFVGGFELAVLNPHLGNVFIPGVGTIGPNFDTEASPRLWAGYVNGEGFGGRIRYWQFDHPGNAGVLGGTFGLEIHALDFEVTQTARWCKLDLNFFGGVRYASSDLSLGVDGIGRVLDLEYDGAGPTVGMEVRRRLSRFPNLAVVGNARFSYLFGETDGTFNLGPIIQNAQFGFGDQTMTVLEAQVGTEYRRPIGNGGSLFARVMLEAQEWESGALFGVFGPDFGFIGPTFSIGVAR